MHSEHPSPEALNAYFDRELAPEERSPLDAHLEACAECRASLEAFGLLAGLAPELDPALPGDAYWADLPDRILARIAAGDPAPAVIPVGEGFWSRLRHPQHFWRYAVGATAAVAVAVGAWAVLINPSGTAIPDGSIRPNYPPDGTLSTPLLVTDASNDFANSMPTMTPIGAAPYIPGQNRANDDGPDVAGSMAGPSISPGSFIRRSWVTLGSGADAGTSLDIASGEGNRTLSSSAGGLGTPVAESLPPLGPDFLRETEGVVGYGCGVDTLELAFTSALKAEEDGNFHLAAMGYRAVRDASRPGQRLYQAADFRLNVLLWRERVQRAYASEQQRAQVLSDLQAQMTRAVETWQRTQNALDCQKAECMTRVFLTLGPEVINPEQLSGPRADLKNFKRCSD